jgi:hypothetical protein
MGNPYSSFSCYIVGLCDGRILQARSLSKLWDGDTTKEQTPRMRAFLGRYLSQDHSANTLSIQLWRHTLMHTSRPRRLRDSTTGSEFTYLLHWGAPELSRDDHYRVSGGNKLNFGLEHFIEDLGTLLTKYLDDLAESDELQTKALAIWPKIEIQDFKMYRASRSGNRKRSACSK